MAINIDINPNGEEKIKQYSNAFDTLRDSISGVSKPIMAFTNDMNALGKAAKTTADSISKISSQNKEFKDTGNKAAETVKGLHEVFGIFKETIETLKKTWLTWETALSGGLALLVTFAPEIIEWVKAWMEGKDAIDKAKLSLTEMNGALQSSDYSNAVAQMNDLKINVGLAKSGFIDKNKVLQQYNDGLGKTMGQVSSLSELENKITKNGDAYIKMTFLKATAQLALQDAAKKASEAEQDKLKSDDDVLTGWDKTKDFVRQGVHSLFAVGIDVDAYADRIKTAAKRRKEAVDDANKQKDALLDIAKKYQTQAAALATQTGMNLSGDTTRSNKDNAAQQQALSQLDQIKKASLERQLQDTTEAYGKEVMVLTTQYQTEQKQLDDSLKNKLISRKQYNEASVQLTSNHHADLKAVIDKFNAQDAEATQKAQNELVTCKLPVCRMAQKSKRHS